MNLLELLLCKVFTEGLFSLVSIIYYWTLGVSTIPTSFFYIWVYEYFNDKSRSFLGEKNRIVSNASSGVIAEIFSAIFCVPSDNIGQRLQNRRTWCFHYQKNQSESAFKVIKVIWNQYGIKGFYRGYFPHLLVHCPGSAIWWATYEFSKRLLIGDSLLKSEKSLADPKLSFTLMTCGAISGIFSYLFTNPIEVAKVRLQLSDKRCLKDNKLINSGFLKCIYSIYKNEGFSGLFKGSGPRLLIRVPVAAIIMWSYDLAKILSIENTIISEDKIAF